MPFVRLLLTALVAAEVMTGCASAFLQQPTGYDSRAISVQTLSLFNQREPSRFSKTTWRGDWLLRRERLELIDSELRNVKPDILVLQEAMSKSQTFADADRSVLLAGALADYDWHEVPIADYTDSQETESMAIAVALPLSLATLADEDSGGPRSFWSLGPGGYLMAARVDFEGQPISVFDVQLPTSGQSAAFVAIGEHVKEWLKSSEGCLQRIVIAGYIPNDDDTSGYNALLASLRLKDAASGYCQIGSRCYTETPENDIFLATRGDQSPRQADRILLPTSAFVYSSARDFDTPAAESRSAKRYALNHLWPTQRFGWSSSARLAKCHLNDGDLSR